jgi:phytoene dehydrogenase-like protein
MATDVLVIGAGHNGLVCAAYLAKAGRSVLVVERSHRVGGACITEELVPGYRFSTFAYGAHGPGLKICRDLEIPAGAFTVIENDPGMFFPFPDGDHILLWADQQRSAEGLRRFGPREADGFRAYGQFMKLAKEIAKDTFLGPPPTHAELYERYRNTPHGPALEALLTRSHWDVLCDYFDNENVRCAFARADDVGYPTAVGSLLAEVMESANDGAGTEGKEGTGQGGMGAVSAALADAARRFGVEIRVNCPVERVVVENGRATGVHLAGGEFLPARCVVSNADPKRTFLKLVAEPDLDAGFRRQVQELKTRAGYMKYHAILSDVPRFAALPGELAGDPRAVASVRIAPSLDYYEQAWRDAQSGIPAREPVMSLQLPTAYTPEMAPPGKHIFGAWVRPAEGRHLGRAAPCRRREHSSCS